MQLSGLLDVAVTIVVTFVLTSLLCTTINELLATLLNTRAKVLRRTVAALLDDQKVRQSFFDNGLIKSLGIGSSGGKGGPPDAGADDSKNLRSSYIDGRTFADALLGSLEPASPIPGMDVVERSIGTLKDGQIKAALSMAVASAKGEISSVRDEIARWFDTAMDRLSGHYTRYMKWLSLGVGLAVAIVLNIDCVDIAMISWQDPQVRATGVSIAQNLDPSQFPACPDNPDKVSCLIESIAGANSQLGRLPIGWSNYAIAWTDASWWLSKLIGWLITALAASVGAAFWFDILQNVMSLRGAGKKVEESTSGAK